MPPNPPAFTPAPVDESWPAPWVAVTLAGLLAVAWWQGHPSWGPAAAAAVAALLALVAMWLAPSRGGGRWPAALATAALAAAAAMALTDTRTLRTVETAWPAWAQAEREARADEVAGALTAWAGGLQQAANEALEAWTDTLPPTVARPAGPRGAETALLAYDGGRLVAQVGQFRTPVRPGAETGVRLVEGPFHSSLVAVARRGAREVVAVGLVAALPPANRLAQSLLAALTPQEGDEGLTEVESPDSVTVHRGSTVVVVPSGARRLARVRAMPLPQESTQLHLIQRARVRTGVALLAALVPWLVVAWRRPARTRHRVLVTGGVLALVAVLPLASLSNVAALFDPASYFVARGGPLTSTLAGLLVSAVMLLALLLALVRSPWPRPWRHVAWLVVAATAVGGPYLLRWLADGITWPSNGAGFGLWLGWHLGLALVATALLLLGAVAGRAALGGRHNVPPAVAPLLALACGAMAPLLWRAPGQWPAWYPLPWGVAVAALAFTRRGGAQLVAAAVVAGSAASTLTWGSSVAARQQLAEQELALLSRLDENATRLLGRLALTWGDLPRRGGARESLLRRYAASELAQAGFPARLAEWTPASGDVPGAAVTLVAVQDTVRAQAGVAELARVSREIELRSVPDGPATLLVAAIPGPSGEVTTIAVPPRTRLLPSDPFRTLTGVSGEPEGPPPFRLALLPAVPGEAPTMGLAWERVGATMRGHAVSGIGADARRVLVEVPMGSWSALLTRGVLLVFVDVVVVLALWLVTGAAGGSLGRLLARRLRRWRRSFRVRLTAALAGFFVAPALWFGAWGWYQLQDDDRAIRALLLGETLRVAEAEREAGLFGAAPSSTGAPLLLYEGGVLTGASDSLLTALAPLGRLLPGGLLADGAFPPEGRVMTRRIGVGGATALVGYRQLAGAPGGEGPVLASPARGETYVLDARRTDLWMQTLCLVLFGALSAAAASGWAARLLAEPVRTLRDAALALAAGRRPHVPGTAPASEFVTVYDAFTRMAGDLAVSRAALEASQRQTAAVLQQVASGVVALDTRGRVLLSNPQAAELLGMPPAAPGEGGAVASGAPLPAAVAARCEVFLAGTAAEDALELELAGRQLRGRLTRLTGGAVLTVDDVTELARAQRVLAWGEMARQVAHEIKNPLTPMRLGVQHLRRAYQDGRSDFAQVLNANVTRVLAEIDRLDGIARAFSRYGTAPERREPPEAVDVARVAADVVALERLGSDGDVMWVMATPGPDAPPPLARGRAEELSKVLLNLLENARLAEARTVTLSVEVVADRVVVAVRDDGAGMAADVLPRVFEPHFSTRTSGSGLGLAISRRLVEGWGGTLSLESAPGAGTTARLSLARWEPVTSAPVHYTSA
ncbi:MAG: hypothetical protein KJT01_08470 [Gemmatimonadetes bacterium]|nr:hypothetical protein [Gemmatimonadota bacterium]